MRAWLNDASKKSPGPWLTDERVSEEREALKSAWRESSLMDLQHCRIESMWRCPFALEAILGPTTKEHWIWRTFCLKNFHN